MNFNWFEQKFQPYKKRTGMSLKINKKLVFNPVLVIMYTLLFLKFLLIAVIFFKLKFFGLNLTDHFENGYLIYGTDYDPYQKIYWILDPIIDVVLNSTIGIGAVLVVSYVYEKISGKQIIKD